MARFSVREGLLNGGRKSKSLSQASCLRGIDMAMVWTPKCPMFPYQFKASAQKNAQNLAILGKIHQRRRVEETTCWA